MKNKLGTFAGKTVWLTGASSGIGESLAFEIARRGARVAISARREQELKKVAEKIEGLGQIAKAYPADVLSELSLKTAVAGIERDLGPIDIVIANAGSHVFTVPEEFNTEEYLSLMNLNYGGMLRTISSVLPQMLDKKNGAIVGVASLAGFRGLPRAAAYGASKSAQIHFLESIRYHLEEHGLQVTVINPGFVKTPLTDKNDFYMPFLVPPERAAVLICNAIEKGKKELSFPIPFSWFMKLMRVVPYPIHEIVARLAWKMTL